MSNQQDAAAPEILTPVANEHSDVQIVLAQDDEVVAVAAEDVEQLDSSKANAIRSFDDSTVRVLRHTDLPTSMRSSRGKAHTLATLDQFHIVPGLNPRLDTKKWEEHIEWLTGQMLEHGFRSDCPLRCFITHDTEGKLSYGIISGESRYHAAKRAIARGGLQEKHIPLLLAPEGMSMEEMTVDLATSNTGKPFTPLEQAMLAQRFSKWGRTPTQIAVILKCTKTYVLQLLVIASAPHRVREMIQNGDISVQVALKELQSDSTQAVKKLESAVDAAKKTGRGRVTAKFLPEAQAQKAARSFAPGMKTVLEKIKDNEGLFALLDDDVRVEIEALLLNIATMASKTPEDSAKAKADAEAARDANKAKALKKKADAEQKKADREAKKNLAAQKKVDREAKKNLAAEKTVATAKPPKAKAAPKTTKAPQSEAAAKPPSGTTVRVRDKLAHEEPGEDLQTHPED